MKVTVNHNGSTRHEGLVYLYEAGVEVDLPEAVLAAIGEANYSVEGAEPKEDATQVAEEVKQPEQAEEAKVEEASQPTDEIKQEEVNQEEKAEEVK